MPHSDSEAGMEDMKARIIVAEDEVLIRFVIADALRSLGVCVIEAASADEAWDYLKAGALVDLVFTDHHMPGSMTGTELAIRIHQEYPAIRVIVTSGALKANDHTVPILEKPYDPSETAAALASIAMENRWNGRGGHVRVGNSSG